MKKIVLSIFLLLTIAKIQAQYVNLPDTTFRNYLMTISPNCFNAAKQLDTTCSDLLMADTLYIDETWPNNLDSIRNIDGVQYYKSLKALFCSGGLGLDKPRSIKYIPYLPNSLKYLNCSFNQIESLPKLPDSLLVLNCWVNNIDNLPDLPPLLVGIECSSNKIKKIPTIPSSLQYLWCGDNLLDSLPKLNSALVQLSCYSNNIKTIPQLPNTLQLLYLMDNKLTSLPPLPDSLIELNCNVNSIFCLPKLPVSLQVIKFDTTKILCIPNSVSGFNYPVCNATNNANGCASIYPSISGRVYYDSNSNGIKDNTELYVNSFKMSLSNNSYTFSNDSGYYYLAPDTVGSFAVTAQIPTYTNVIPITTVYNFTKYDTNVIQNIAIQPIVFKDSLHVTLTLRNPIRIGGQFDCQVDIKNTGTTNLANVSSVLNYDTSRFIFDTAVSFPFAHSNGNLVANFSNLPFYSYHTCNAYFKVKTTAALGDTIKMVNKITSGSLIEYDTVNKIITSAFDPNDKQATPELSTTEVAQGKKIDYTIRFQNTGNDTAFHVVIADTLDSKLDHNSLQMIATSHKCKTTMKDNIIFFEMREIMLPDSNVDKLGSSGFIRFSMQPKSTVSAGDNIPNTAAIYFDYNKPVITNTAITQIKNPLLPLNILSYELIVVNNTRKIVHQWVTSNEVNTQSFIIQESADGRIYKSVAEIAAKGYGNNTYNKELIISSNSNILYYRILAKDKNGNYQFSDVKIVNLKPQVSNVTILSNPAINEIVFIVNDKSLLSTNASLINNTGVVVKKFVISSLTQKIATTNLPKGVYYLHTNNGVESLIVSN